MNCSLHQKTTSTHLHRDQPAITHKQTDIHVCLHKKRAYSITEHEENHNIFGVFKNDYVKYKIQSWEYERTTG